MVCQQSSQSHVTPGVSIVLDVLIERSIGATTRMRRECGVSAEFPVTCYTRGQHCARCVNRKVHWNNNQSDNTMWCVSRVPSHSGVTPGVSTVLDVLIERSIGATTRMRRECGVSAEFPVAVVLHQGSALC